MRYPLAALPLLAMAAPAAAQSLFFADIFSPTLADGSIRRVDPDGFNLQPVIDTGGGLRSVAVDPVHSKVYWCDVDNFKISRANLDGSSPQDIITSGLQFPSAIALDLVHGKLYWGDQTGEEIWSSNLDGSSPALVVSTLFYRGLAVDPAAGKIYWTTSITPSTGDLKRANLDGTSPETLLNGTLTTLKPASIAIDPQRNRLYFTDSTHVTLKRMNLDGTNLTPLYTDPFGMAPRGVAVNPANGDVYWGHDTSDEPLLGEIQTAIGGEPIFQPVATGLGEVISIAFLPAGGAPPCYPNCDNSTTPPVLNVQDFSCFLNKFASGDSYANCDNSTTPPVLNIQDFSCFLNRFAAGCS